MLSLFANSLFNTLRFRTGGDTGRYLSGTNMLINGKLPQGESLSYMENDMIVALCLLFGGGKEGFREICFTAFEI